MKEEASAYKNRRQSLPKSEICQGINRSKKKKPIRLLYLCKYTKKWRTWKRYRSVEEAQGVIDKLLVKWRVFSRPFKVTDFKIIENKQRTR
jgi:hypothetical protein